MAENSKIEWTHHTANLWHGCTKVHAGCDHCYAETLSRRWNRDIWGNDKPRMLVNSVWNDLHKFQKIAQEKGELEPPVWKPSIHMPKGFKINGAGTPYTIKDHAFALWAKLWCDINGQESWNQNPWVWVISFKVLSTTGKSNL